MRLKVDRMSNGDYKYPFDTMEVGDEFHVPYSGVKTGYVDTAVRNVRAAASIYGGRHKQRHTTQHDANGLVVRRLA